MSVETKKKSKGAVFASRLLSTLVLWGLIAGSIFWGKSIPYFVIISVLSFGAAFEYFKMLGRPDIGGLRNCIFAGGALYLGWTFWHCYHTGNSEAGYVDGFSIAFCVIACTVVLLRREMKGRATFEALAEALFGFVYIFVLFNFLTKLLFLPPGSANGNVAGTYYALYLITVTKFTDMGAYVVGSLIGKHKMIPHISPGKTWEGFAGAIVIALLGSYVIVGIFGEHLQLLTWTHATILAVILALGSVVGDLAESVLKRSLNVKDSGSFLPGIGGTLDLIDSLLFTAPMLYFYLKYIV